MPRARPTPTPRPSSRPKPDRANRAVARAAARSHPEPEGDGLFKKYGDPSTYWDAATGTETACSEYSPQDKIVLNTRALPDPGEWEEAGQDAFWSVDIAGDVDGWSAAASIPTPDAILHTMVSAMLAPAIRDIGDLDDLAVGAAVIGAAELTEIPSSPSPLDVHRAQAARRTSPARAAADSTRIAVSAPALSPQPAARPVPRPR
ncbi:hypothetical protein GCM10010519_04880 [Streptomyces lactacystinicus]